MLGIRHPFLARASIQIIARVEVHTWLICEHFNNSTTRRMVHSANLKAQHLFILRKLEIKTRSNRKHVMTLSDTNIS